MRIISGTLKGRSINFLKNKNTRPLKDSVRESIFNILKHSRLIKINIEKSRVLDLYSGVGSFGIECLSRGAEKVSFVEQDLDAAKILKSNLLKLCILKKTNIYIKTTDNYLMEDIKEKFNIFFLDPPYADTDFFQSLQLIKEKKIFEKNNLIIIHREKKTDEDFKSFLKIIETKYYGRSKIIFGIIN
tara:strand:- start:484 stop:1044 length:561 start_codon:yes stop_codon:yes gene_type:complete